MRMRTTYETMTIQILQNAGQWLHSTVFFTELQKLGTILAGNCSVMLSTLWFENAHIISVVS